jgi:V-type H+-transporting ATPase subunit C
VRSLADIVLREHFVQDSEYLETVLVAVPRYAPVDTFHIFGHTRLISCPIGSKKCTEGMEWQVRAAEFDGCPAVRNVRLLVPHSLISSFKPNARMIAQDEEYTLFAVVIFRRVHDDFVQKCRENKFASLAVSPCDPHRQPFIPGILSVTSSIRRRR